MPRLAASCLRGALLATALACAQTHAMADPSADEPVVIVRRNELLQLAQTGDSARRQNGAELVAVLYPDIGEPLRKVFVEIIEGVEERTKFRVHGYPIGANQDMAELSGTLKRNGTRVVIALGRQGLKAAGTLDLSVGVIVSGVSTMPDGEKQLGIVLTPDPALLFSQLKTLVPGTRRVLVVYNPQNNEWLIKLAREAARSHGLELVAYEARDLASAARLYETAFANADSRHDALWLPTDATTVDESTILPIVLREAWNRNVPVFSSSFLHVKKGALFALYPNNQELGRDLGTLALGLVAGESARRGVMPLRQVHTALNTRTASHIGVNVSQNAQRNFNFIFPEP
ncbi:MAG: ABC transporter substrate binding protein [Pseudomonadota bacterium]